MGDIYSYILIGIASVIAYLLGSVNTAIIVSKYLSGEDIRNMGSGNAGMTNVMRNYGKKAGIFTLIGDAAKGMVAIIIMTLLLRGFGYADERLILFAQYIANFFALLGHVFPVFYKFKGGKGIAVCIGSILLYDIRVALILIIVFGALFLITKMVSVGSICAAATFPISTFLLQHLIVPTGTGIRNTVVALLIAGLVIFMHRTNIVRILNGTESKFSKKKEA